MVALFEAAARFTDRLPGAGAETFLEYLLDQELPADSLAPAADLGEVARLGLSNGAATALVGGRPEDVPEAWADADPARQRLTVPAVIVTGELDDVVPASVVESYVASRGPEEPLHTAVARGADHFDLIDPDSPAYLLLLAEVEELTLHH